MTSLPLHQASPPPRLVLHASRNPPPKDQVQDYIDTTLVGAIDELLSSEGQPSITLRRRPKRTSFIINPSNGALQTNEEESFKTYTWPGQDAHEAWRFTVTFRILAVIAEAIQTGLVVSKRDMYYNDPACFGSQRVVDTIVEDIAHTVGVERVALNVEAAAKGLVAGWYSLTMISGEVIDAQASTKENLVPRLEDINTLDISDVEWVLVLEKEAVFQRLARNSYHTTAAAGKGILITGKGYPDIRTRAFLRRLYDSRCAFESRPRFYALVDSDPDGMVIMSTYKYGSMAYAHENDKLNVPGLQWLGLRTSDVVKGVDPHGEDALIRLTARNRKKVVAMQRNSPVCAADGPEQEWRVELQQMLMLNMKAEIEILYDREGGIEGWLDQKMAAL